MPIHIDKRGRSSQQHLGNTQTGPEIDIVSIEFCLERPDFIIEPRHQWHIIGITAHQTHRDVIMQVNKARHRHFVLSIYFMQ